MTREALLKRFEREQNDISYLEREMYSLMEEYVSFNHSKSWKEHAKYRIEIYRNLINEWEKSITELAKELDAHQRT